MYGCFDAVMCYGVLEINEDDYCEIGCKKIIDSDFLEENDIELFTTNIVRLHGCNYIYGINITNDDMSINIPENDKKIVDNFCKKYNLGIPKVYLGIYGDWEIQKSEIKTYIPEEQN